MAEIYSSYFRFRPIELDHESRAVSSGYRDSPILKPDNVSHFAFVSVKLIIYLSKEIDYLIANNFQYFLLSVKRIYFYERNFSEFWVI